MTPSAPRIGTMRFAFGGYGKRHSSMTRVMTTDILFRDCPEPDMLREVAANAFQVPVDRVSVIESVGPELIPDDALVVFMHQPDAMPGDFPAWYGLNVAPD